MATPKSGEQTDNLWCYFVSMSEMGENVRRGREQLGLSQADLARMAGTTQTTIDKIERGMSRHSKFLPAIARVMGIALSDLSSDYGPQPVVVPIPREELVGNKDLAIYSATEGGDGTIIINNEPIDYVLRPAPLVHVRKGYGVIIVGDSMIPVFRPGDTALVHPLLPPRAEDVCVFIGNAGGHLVSTIKEYISETPTEWRVKRYRPNETEFTLAKAQWPTCHLVVGKYSRR